MPKRKIREIVTPDGYVERLVYEEPGYQIWRKEANPNTGYKYIYEIIPVDRYGRRIGDICPEPFSLEEAKKLLEEFR